jgi:polyvinyl alcohol dehydrogenase (cytochrome)
MTALRRRPGRTLRGALFCGLLAAGSIACWMPSFAVAADPATPQADKSAAVPWKPGDALVPASTNQVCAGCHEHGGGHAPAVYILKIMTPASIYGALTTGAMRVQAKDLSDEDKKSVAEFLTGAGVRGDSKLAPPPCEGAASRFDPDQPPAYSGWGLTPENTRYADAATAGLDSARLEKLHLKWALGFDGAVRVRSQPALAGGAIYLGTQDARVDALDRQSGCLRWQFQAAAEVRTGIVAAPWAAKDDAGRLLYFGDIVGNVYAVDARSGALVWRDHTDPHPSTTLTAAPALYGSLLFMPVSSLEEGVAGEKYDCCTFRGSIIAYDAATGRRVWQRLFVPVPKPRGKLATGARMYGPSGIAIWDTPSIDAKRGVLYVGTGDNYSSPPTSLSDSVVALELASGKVKWSYQARARDAWNAGCVMSGTTACPVPSGPDYDFGAATILATGSDGRQFVLAAAKSGWVYALDPDFGTLVWKTKVGRGGIVAGVYFGMATRGDTVFVPINDAPDGRHYEESAKPGLYALDLYTGAYRWKAPTADEACENRGALCAPGIAAPVTVADDLVLSGASDGRLRFYSADSGKLLWQYDTMQDTKTVGGGTARGGSMGGGAGVIAYHGTVIVESGYGFAGRIPGNLMLVFGTD